jgi:hypothetical protein
VKNFGLFVSIFFAFWLTGCATSYDRFVDVMGFYISHKTTHKDLITNSGHRWADPEFLRREEKLANNQTAYHYAHPNIFDRQCHYYLVVDDSSDLIVGWGFDIVESDPRVNCGISGGF